jgi:hypothetical protein
MADRTSESIDGGTIYNSPRSIRRAIRTIRSHTSEYNIPKLPSLEVLRNN